MRINRQGSIAHGAIGAGACRDNIQFAAGGGAAWNDSINIIFQYGGSTYVNPTPPPPGTPPTTPPPGGGLTPGSDFCALGMSWFWLMAGLKYWPAQVQTNLDWIAQRLKPDYLRVFAVVGGREFTAGSSDGLPHDPWQYAGSYLNWSDYDTLQQRVVDMLYERNIKTQWTFTGTIQQTPTAADQEALVRRVARNMQGRMHKLFLVEMMNEYIANEGTIAILKRMATVAAPLFSGVPISLSSPNAVNACGTPTEIQSEVSAMYSGFPAANAITPHWCRSAHVPPALGSSPPCPTLKYCNEPRGQGASAGGSEESPTTLAGDYQASINAGYAGYVWHQDWGVWADHLHPAFVGDGNGEWANLDDVPNSEATATALKNIRSGLNPGAGSGAAPPASLQSDIDAELALWPAVLDVDQCGEIMNNVAWKNRAIGWGVNRKTGGNHATRHDGALIAVDIVHHQPSDHIVDTLIGSPGPEDPHMDPSSTWNDLGPNPNLAAGRIWVAPIAPIAPYTFGAGPMHAVAPLTVVIPPSITPYVTVIPSTTAPQLGFYTIPLGEFNQATDPPKSATVIYGSVNGHWVAWMEGLGIYSSSTVGFTKPEGMLLGIGPDGSVAYRPTVTGTGLRVYQPRGHVDYEVTTAFVADVVVAGEGQILWREGTQLKTRGLPTAKVLTGVSSAPKLTLVRGKWWIGYQSTTRGMVLHPLDSTQGFEMPGGVIFDIATLDQNPVVIRWAYATNASEAAGTIQYVDVNTEAETFTTGTPGGTGGGGGGGGGGTIGTPVPTPSIPLGPGITVPGVPVQPPTLSPAQAILQEFDAVVLSSTATFDVVPAAEELVTLPIEVYPSYPTGRGHGRIIHPTLGAFDYEVKPDEWVNIDADAIISPVWASSRTLTSAANVLWEGNLRDVRVEERWKSLGGLAMPITQLRMLLAIWTTPIDPDVGYVQWYPNYITERGFRVLPINLSSGGQGIAVDDVANYKDEDGEPIGWVTSPVTFTLQLVERL